MTNLKKIGLTALAGTLASTSYAIAGDLSVSGTARMEYQSTARLSYCKHRLIC
jgi:outer membrane protein OmpU